VLKRVPLLAAVVGVLLVVFQLPACGGDDGGGAGREVATAKQSTVSGETQTAKSEARADAHSTARRREKPLPAFSGLTLDGQRVDVASLIGKRLLLFFFNPEVRESAVVGDAVQRISKLRGEHNFEIVGVAVGASRNAAREFARKLGADYAIIDDSDARIARRFGLREPTSMLGVDAEGYVVFGFAHFNVEGSHGVARIEKQLRTALRLPEDEDGSGDPMQRPMAPAFSARILDREESFELAAVRGQPVVLLFFLHTCPHCHEFLHFMKEQLPLLPEGKRPVFVGVELTGKTYSVRSRLKQEGLDFFPVLFDDDRSIANAYGSFGGVPDTVLIDAEGRITARMQGWTPETDGPLLRMRLARLSGAPVPMLLRQNGYSGNEVCSVCHESERDTWLMTSHASAFDTLVKHGADSNAECVSCHVVGFGREGGFEISPRNPNLEDVGCESCHGRGGPHLSTELVKRTDYEPDCVQCHDAKHSLGFDYASFLPRISHAANKGILALPPGERQRILEERGALRKELLPTAADHVGSLACQSCHPAEFETWSGGPHARAVASLAKTGKEADADCLACHTTAFGRSGGFPEDAAVAQHEDLARVGCESCHGPGGDHVKEGTPKIGNIVSLGDKCDSCVILQICGSCHDDANDPGFEFEVLDKIEAIRHGTIEAGTGRKLAPGEKSAGLRGAPDVDARGAGELVERAFAWIDGGEMPLSPHAPLPAHPPTRSAGSPWILP
jgi:peroxiredoxin